MAGDAEAAATFAAPASEVPTAVLFAAVESAMDIQLPANALALFANITISVVDRDGGGGGGGADAVDVVSGRIVPSCFGAPGAFVRYSCGESTT